MPVRAEPTNDHSLGAIPLLQIATRFSRADAALVAFTLARLVLVPIMIMSFFVAPALMTAALGLFIFMDVYDGVLARRYDADGPTRRAVDSIVDRIGIDGVLIAAYFAGALPAVFLGAFLARDAYCAIACAVMVSKRKVAIKADWVYRALNLSVAAWAVSAPFVSGSARNAFAAVVLAASALVVVDLTRSVRKVISAPAQIVDTVVRAGSLRRSAVDWRTATYR
jgi:phosphatidylglycerophosphate synthase